MVANFQAALCPRAVDGRFLRHVTFATRMYSVHRNETIRSHAPHRYTIKVTESGYVSPARADRLKIFTPNLKDCQLQYDLGLV